MTVRGGVAHAQHGAKPPPFADRNFLTLKDTNTYHDLYPAPVWGILRVNMVATIFVPTPMRKLTGGQGKIQIDASNLQEAIERADAEFPGFSERVLDGNGEIKRFINVFINGVDVRTLQGRATPVKDGDQVAVIPAMAGGCLLTNG